ncbi:hypothetical protein ZWY2020_015512 [Hordeum vulgare]|nr:hypothetical protein ZWY2020_015512 [Hordeum vulgare]
MGNSRPGGAPPTSSGSVARGNTEAVSEAPRLRPHGAPAASGSGSPGRSTPLPGDRERASTGGNVMTPSYDRQQNRAAEEARLGASSLVKKTSVPNSLSRGSEGISGSRMGAEEQVMGEHASNGDAGSSSKKRPRRMDASYIKRFKTGVNVVVAYPDRMGKENTSSGHVTDSNTAILCEGGRLIEKSKGHSSHAACKVSKSPISGLHETSDTRVDQCSTPLSEVQPHKPTDVQNVAAESSLPAKARDPHTGPARQNILPSFQSVPISTIHHEEIKSTLGDAEPISVQKENSAPGHLQVARSDGTDGNPNICVACGLGSPGTFRSCDGKGCKSRYHMSCLDQYLSLGNWFCTSCTKKRLQFGLHHIVDGIESVWDVKEAEGMQTSKQYFVKYKNLAHVHNRWVPEGIISVMPGGPDLLSSFNKRNHTEKTIRKEWTKPHRLLSKRLLVPPRLAEDFFRSDDFFCSSGVSYCTLEWLVKWRGLGYDHATWELETLSCLCTPEADKLKENYENRREDAKQSSIPPKTKVKQSSFQKLESLPDGCHPDFDNDHLYSINHVREYWHKSRGAVLVDDKEYVIKTVLFTMSVLPDVSQPFLILTTPDSLSLWEVQFNKLAPFVNVVVYDGGKDELKLIRDLEFYESGSRNMLQVLLSHPDAILEDIEPIAHIGWEAVIVDYYQKSALQYLEQLKQFPTDFRMLLVSSPVKDNLAEYVKLLAFLNSVEQENENYVDTAETLKMLEGTFKSHIAYERQSDSSKILEYWVPAYVSQLQLQMYCSILLSSSSVLQSQMTSDKALYDIIISLSKCCDDPYPVDEFLPNPPVNNHDHTDPIPPQSSHEILQNMEEPAKVPAEDANESRRKRRKVGKITGPSKRTRTPKYLHVQLKKELSKLITALQLPDDVRAMVEQLFEYFLKNHLVATEPVGMLHAFIIALCLRAASVLKYKINCGESIALAGKSLNCECNEELAEFIYKGLRFPEEKNPNRAIETRINSQPVSVVDTQISCEETSTNLRNNHMLQNEEMDHGNLASGGPQEASSGAERMISEEQEPVQETHTECHLSNDELPTKIVEKRTELVDNDDGPQEASSGAERMISEGQEPVQETHTECHLSNDELPTKIVEKRTELVDNDDGNFANGALQEVSSNAEHMISEVQEPVQESHGECHLSNDEPPNMIVEESKELVDNNHINFTNGAPQVVSSGAEHMILEEQEPIQDLSNDDLPNMITEKRMKLIDNVFSLRENNILCKQQLEISGLDTYTQNEVMRLKEVCKLILEHIRRSHIDEMTRSDIIFWFTMLMYAFLEHMRLQHNKLNTLQFRTWSVERHMKENLHQVAKSGQLDLDFGRHIALPDSNFVMEEFIHFKEQNKVAISTQAMENEPVATSVDSGEGPASEAVDLPENSIRCSSDDIGVQRAGCSSSTIPANDDSIGQESSTGECRNTEHAEADNIANLSMLLEGSDSLVRGLNANNDDTVDTDQVHLESPSLASSQILRNPDDRSQTGCQPDRATDLWQGGTATSCHSARLPYQCLLNLELRFANQVCMWNKVLKCNSQPQCKINLQKNEHCIEPSLDSHAGAESTDMLGAVTAPDLQLEIQPSASIHDRPAGAEGAGTLGSTAAQDLQPERQLSTTVQHIPLEIGHEQPTQLPPIPALVFHNPILSDEPLKNELEKIIHWTTLLDKGHEDKRSQLQTERNQEIEKINRKYDSLLQNEDSAHRQKRIQLDVIYQKVYVSKSLAENFRRQFTPSVASPGRSTGHIMDQLPESSSASQGPASLPVIPSPTVRAQVHNSAGPYVRPSPVASRPVQSQSTMPGNLSGAAPSPFVPVPLLHASNGPGGSQSRAIQPQPVPPSILVRTMAPAILMPGPQGSHGRPAGAVQLRAASPHLQHRMRPPHGIIHMDYQQQQQLPVIPGVPARGQFVPVSTESLRPAFTQPGAAVLASMTTPAGPAHQPTLPSASGSGPATPAYIVPPGWHPEAVWTPNPVLTLAQLQQQASYLNRAMGGSGTSAGPAAPGGQQHAGGAHIPAVLNLPGLEALPPPSNNSYMPARFGLEPGSGGGGNAAGTEVVCLSDDEA